MFTQVAQSVQGRAMGWTAGVPFLGAERYLFLLYSVQTGSGAHSVSYAMCTWGSFLGVKRPRREADNSPSSSAEVKNGGVIPTLPHTSSWLDALIN
jgi:hypothetical protein